MHKRQKEMLLETAIDLLNKMDVDDIETVDVDSTNYDDGSSSFTVTVNYPAEGDKVGIEADRRKLSMGILLDEHPFVNLNANSFKQSEVDTSRNCDRSVETTSEGLTINSSNSTDIYQLFSVVAGEKYCRKQRLTPRQFNELIESLNDDSNDYVMFGEQVVCREEVTAVEKV